MDFRTASSGPSTITRINASRPRSPDEDPSTLPKLGFEPGHHLPDFLILHPLILPCGVDIRQELREFFKSVPAIPTRVYRRNIVAINCREVRFRRRWSYVQERLYARIVAPKHNPSLQHSRQYFTVSVVGDYDLAAGFPESFQQTEITIDCDHDCLVGQYSVG